MSDTHVYAPWTRALLGTAPQFCEVVVLKSRTPLAGRIAPRIRACSGARLSAAAGPHKDGSAASWQGAQAPPRARDLSPRHEQPVAAVSPGALPLGRVSWRRPVRFSRGCEIISDDFGRFRSRGSEIVSFWRQDEAAGVSWGGIAARKAGWRGEESSGGAYPPVSSHKRFSLMSSESHPPPQNRQHIVYYY